MSKMMNSSYKLNEERVLFTELEDEGVLYDMETNQYFALNPSLSAIIRYIQKDLIATEIVQNLMKEFEVDQETCENQVENSLGELLKKKYIYASNNSKG
jgi:hypothetical protein